MPRLPNTSQNTTGFACHAGSASAGRFQTLLQLRRQRPGGRQAGEVAFDVGQKHRHAEAREVVGEHLQRHGLAGAGRAGDQAVAIGERQDERPRRFLPSCGRRQTVRPCGNDTCGLSAPIKDHLAGAASQLAALLLPQIFPIFSVVAPCHLGAARAIWPSFSADRPPVRNNAARWFVYDPVEAPCRQSNGSGRTSGTAAACSRRARASRSSPSSRWRSASAPTAPSSASPTRCCCGRCRSPGQARSSPSARRSSLEALNASSLVSSYRDYVDIRDRSKSFEGLAAFTYVTVGFASDPNAPPKLKMGMLRQRQPVPADGRRADHRPRVQARRRSGPRPRRRRRARPHDVGAGIRVGSQACSAAACASTASRFTVIGVAPPTFTGMNQYVRSDFFVPLMMSPRVDQRPEDGIARGARRAKPARSKDGSRPGVSQAQAQSELTAIARGSRARLSGHEQESRFCRAHRAAGADRADPPDAMLIAMLSTLALGGAVRRVRERRRAADQPRAGPRARDGAASRDRRRTRTAGAPAGHREPAHRDRRRRARSRRRLCRA